MLYIYMLYIYLYVIYIYLYIHIYTSNYHKPHLSYSYKPTYCYRLGPHIEYLDVTRKNWYCN